MFEKITFKEFMMRQPDYPNAVESDAYYHNVSNRLLETFEKTDFGRGLPGLIAHRVALALTDYLQDVISDGGIWRTFVVLNRKFYNFSVPFHDIPEDYVDFELNREDVRFLTWYSVAMQWPEKRLLSPHDESLIKFADTCFDYLESIYEDAPVPSSFNIAHQLDLHDAEDSEAILHLGNWLFMHCYLLTPAFSQTFAEILNGIDMKDPDAGVELNKRLEEAMTEDSTGPLALFVSEWVHAILTGCPPEERHPDKSGTTHPYYEPFIRATGGGEVKLFDSYESMNRFFIEALGWEEGKEHLSQAKGARDYALMVNRTKGMLMARNVARCLKMPGNAMYDREYADSHAIEFLTVRGRCPGDLLRYALAHNWLPDAHFPHSDDYHLVHDNSDFIARCYLQIYYRD